MDRLNEVIQSITLTNQNTVSALSKITDAVNKHANEINEIKKQLKIITNYINQNKK